MTGWGGRRVARIRQEVIRAYGPVCWLCGGPIGPGQAWDVDHVVPRSRGGGDHIGNLRPAHSRCNRARGSGEAVLWRI